jgi:two-component system chemotaxis response regulator CheB
MFSSKTLEGAKVTLRALELGALDFVPKQSFSSEAEAKDYIRNEVIRKLKGLFGRVGKKIPVPQPLPEREIVPVRPVGIDVGQGYYAVCAIGISTGGPVALRNLLPLLPEKLDGSILIVQHMPPLFTKQLADSLQEISRIRIVEGEEGIIVKKGYAYIAPGGKHMIVEREGDKKIIRILDTQPEMNCKPSVNVMFRSVGSVYGDRACGVIMTGMGTDGYEGMKVMKANGSYLIAQNRESCLIYGMPNLPVKEGLTHEALDINGIAQKLIYLLGVQ